MISNGRFGSALVAFAVAAAMATHAPLLSEFLVQLRDPNILGGNLYALILRWFGYAVVLALGAVIAGGAVLLVGWRTRARGASDWHATLAAALTALCLTPWLGVSLAPVGWLCAAAACLLLDRDDDLSLFALLAVILAWNLLQGGGTLGALLAVSAFLGKPVRRRAFIALGAILVGVPQLHALPWHAYGAHALYLDGLRQGAQRDEIWTGAITPAAIGFCAIVVIAAWYGLRRRERTSDALVFLVLGILALVDARNLPYFAIACAPLAADALASYYVQTRTAPRATTLGYAPAVFAAAVAFIAIIAVSEPKVAIWPPAAQEPGSLLQRLAADDAPHQLLCTQPRWCDGVQLAFPRVLAFADDRAGIEEAHTLRVQRDVSSTMGNWRGELARSGVDAIIADRNDSVVSLLNASGWRVRAGDPTRVLLEP